MCLLHFSGKISTDVWYYFFSISLNEIILLLKENDSMVLYMHENFMWYTKNKVLLEQENKNLWEILLVAGSQPLCGDAESNVR